MFDTVTTAIAWFIIINCSFLINHIMLFVIIVSCMSCMPIFTWMYFSRKMKSENKKATMLLLSVIALFIIFIPSMLIMVKALDPKHNDVSCIDAPGMVTYSLDGKLVTQNINARVCKMKRFGETEYGSYHLNMITPE